MINRDEYFNKQIKEILPKQKPLDKKSAFQKNKKLFIIIAMVLLVLLIAVNTYVRFAINNFSQQVNNLPK